MVEIIDYIDNQIKESCIDDVKFFGICHLVEDDNENPYPTQYVASSEKVTPDDKFLITIYHRLLDTPITPDEEVPFGRKAVPRFNQKVRTVVFIKISEDHSKIDDIINALPDTFEIDGYIGLNLSKEISLIRDQNAIWDDEYGDAYKDRMIKKFRAYAFEYDVQYVKCNVCV